MNRRTLAFTALLFLLPLVGCWKEPIQPLPLGQQTVSGLIKPASISVIRRGTHVLIQGGEEIAYLESATVDLGEFEGRTVDVSGTYEANTDPDALPVIVVAAVKGGQSLGRSWTIPSLNISLETPPGWNWEIMGTDVQFTASGSARPILSLFLEEESKLLSADSSSGDVMVAVSNVQGRRAVRSQNASTGVERIQVVRELAAEESSFNILTLLFTPSGEEQLDPAAWDALKDDILRSLRFLGTSSSRASSAFRSSATSESASLGSAGSNGSSAAAVGIPCGGAAGVLCPEGFYCEITDMEANVGRCKAM